MPPVLLEGRIASGYRKTLSVPVTTAIAREHVSSLVDHNLVSTNERYTGWLAWCCWPCLFQRNYNRYKRVAENDQDVDINSKFGLCCVIECCASGWAHYILPVRTDKPRSIIMFLIIEHWYQFSS